MQRQIFVADTADVPGILHQGILDLFCADPWLPFDLLDVERPGSGPLIDRRADVEYVVAHPKEGREKNRTGLPDLVLSNHIPRDLGAGVVVCIEVQDQRDTDKRYSIPFYQGALAHLHRQPTWMAAVSLSPAYSRDLHAWSKGPPPRVDTLILDADTVAPPASLEAARARPMAAMLAAILHARQGDLDAARLGLHAIGKLPERSRLRYTQTLLAAVSRPHRELLEAEQPMDENYKLWSIEREGSPYLYGREEGLEEGLEKGRAQGRRMALIELIPTLLEVRGLTIDDASAQRIQTCEQLELLERWAARARDIHDVAELFEPA